MSISESCNQDSCSAIMEIGLLLLRSIESKNVSKFENLLDIFCIFKLSILKPTYESNNFPKSLVL